MLRTSLDGQVNMPTLHKGPRSGKEELTDEVLVVFDVECRILDTRSGVGEVENDVGESATTQLLRFFEVCGVNLVQDGTVVGYKEIDVFLGVFVLGVKHLFAIVASGCDVHTVAKHFDECPGEGKVTFTNEEVGLISLEREYSLALSLVGDAFLLQFFHALRLLLFVSSFLMLLGNNLAQLDHFGLFSRGFSHLFFYLLLSISRIKSFRNLKKKKQSKIFPALSRSCTRPHIKMRFSGCTEGEILLLLLVRGAIGEEGQHASTRSSTRKVNKSRCGSGVRR